MDPTRPSHVQLANHLSEAALDGGLSAAALRVRRSAILTTCRQIRPERTIALHMSSDVIRAVALRRARTKTRIPAWDLRLVLEFLISRSFEPLESCSLRSLTQKTVFLVMLASGRRASEVHGLSGIPAAISRERDRSFRLNFLPEFLAKNQSPEDPSPSICIKPLSHIAGPEDADTRLCPVRALKVYLNRTKDRRNGPLRRLFVPVNESRHRDIVKTTLSRWISALIKAAYADLASNPLAGAETRAAGQATRGGGRRNFAPLSGQSP